MAKGQPRHTTRNPELIRGVRRFGAAAAAQKSQRHKFAKLGAKGKQTPKATPAVSTKEPKWYAADDVKTPLRSHKAAPRTAVLKKSLTPGTVVIILAGRFRGKRVVFLKQLKSGLLLVTGPYKVNGVPLRRVNQAYTIATSTKIDVSKVDVANIDDAFFARKEAKAAKKADGFFEEKKEKVELPAERKAAQKAVDAALAPVIKATPNLIHYLNAKFTLTKGQFPHQMKF